MKNNVLDIKIQGILAKNFSKGKLANLNLGENYVQFD